MAALVVCTEAEILRYFPSPPPPLPEGATLCTQLLAELLFSFPRSAWERENLVQI